MDDYKIVWNTIVELYKTRKAPIHLDLVYYICRVKHGMSTASIKESIKYLFSRGKLKWVTLSEGLISQYLIPVLDEENKSELDKFSSEKKN